MEKRDEPSTAPPRAPHGDVAAAAKGVLDPALAERKLRLHRVYPAEDLAAFIEHLWIVAWDLEGEAPHVQRTLPYPCVNVVFDRQQTAIFGVMRGTFAYTLEGRGRVLGVRFRPGAFRGLLGRSVSTITDRTLPLADVFGIDDRAACDRVLSAMDDEAMVRAAEGILRPALPPPDPTARIVGQIVDRVGETPDITRVDQLAEVSGYGVRDLQRLFREYVGVSPKWVIRRARLHEAAFRLSRGEVVDLTRFAQLLGYFDQAHFTRDFKAVVGRSPTEYERSA